MEVLLFAVSSNPKINNRSKAFKINLCINMDNKYNMWEGHITANMKCGQAR